MRLYHKLILFLLAASVLPVAVVGMSLLRSAEAELKARIGAQQAASARAAAEAASRDVDEAVESLSRAAGAIRWRELGDEERAGALRLLVRQSRHFVAAGLFDASGRELASVVTRPAEGGAELASLGRGALDAFRAAVPVAALREGGEGAVAMSPTFPHGRFAAAALAVVVPGEGGPWFVAAELSLAALQRHVEELSRGGAGAVVLIDGENRLVAAPGPGALPRPAEEVDPALVRAAGADAAVARSTTAGGEPVLAAAARTPDRLGWTALIRLPEAEAFRPVTHMRRTVLGSIAGALLLLLAGGFLFTRGIARRIEAVAQGARAFGRGELAVRLPEGGSDEMADLAGVFNAMGSELQAARGKLETWNEELQRCVDERTAELKAAQAQLLEAQKLAAIGQLGAGVAHEINNPLAGILGNAQLLLIDRPAGDPDAVALKKIEALARRAKEITSNLLRFSQQRPAPDFKPVDLNRVVHDTLSLVETQLRTEGVQVALELAPQLPAVRGDSGHLSQVLLNLVSNARTAMSKAEARRLTVATSVEEDRVRLRVADTGKGIADKDLPRIFEPFFTTKDAWSNVGLGLSVSFRIVSEHGGRIDVTTKVGEGSSFCVELPRDG